jgi:tetratricopeptide (TPR) repeat protein
MQDAHPVGPAGDDERSARIDSIIGDVMRRRNDGVEADDSAIERQHPDLMPELGQRLRVVRAIETAAKCVAQPSSSGASIDSEGVDFEEDICFLRKALVKYEILERVSYGGQGIVYKAVQRPTQRTVAVKVLLDGPLASQQQRQRFAREVELISRLEHANIVRLYDSGIVRGRPYFAMEYVEGVPIDDYVLLHSLPTADVVRLFVAVCGAVSHAHQQGIIHRDLNPSNILVDLEGIPRILDFGLAKDVWMAGASQTQSLLTISGQVVGTLPYLSPEQAGAGDGQVDVRSDIYSLAIVLFQLLTGGFPYPVGEDPTAVRNSIIAQEPVPLRKALPPDRSAGASKAMIRDLEVILRKALSKEKVLRYQSAAAFTDDLERCLTGDVVEARAASGLYLVQRTFRRYRTAVAVAGLLLFVLSISAVAVTMLWLDARTQRDKARDSARTATGTLFDVITEIDDAISPLAGGMEVRNRLLDGVVAYRLEEMKPLVESDVTMEDLQAALHEKQGDIAYTAGRHAEAANSYETSLAIRRAMSSAEPSTLERSQDLARVHRKLARVSTDAVAHFERAVEIGREVTSRCPNDTDAKYALCETLVEFGRHLHQGGRYEDAAARIDDALEIAGPMVGLNDDNENWKVLLAKAYEWDGDIQIKLGEGERSIESLTESMRLRRRLSDARPADADRRHQVLITCVKLGSVLRDDGQVEEATAALEEAVAAGRYLTSVDPTVAVWKRDLFGAYQRLAQMYLAEGELERAQSHCDAAVDLAEGLVNRESDNAAWRADLAYSYALHGHVLLERKQLERACSDFESALTIRQELCRENPSDLALRERLAASHAWLGLCFRKLGRSQAALEHYQRAYDLTEALFALQPAVTQRAVDLIQSKTRLAGGYIQLDTPEGNENARTLLGEATASLDALRNSGELARLSGIYSSLMEAIRADLAILTNRARERTCADDAPSSAESPNVVPPPEHP